MQATHQHLGRANPTRYYVYPSIDVVWPPHWHEAIEIVYALDDGIEIGFPWHTVTLNAGDIAVINSDDVHCFLQQETPLARLIVQIEPVYYQSFVQHTLDKKFSTVHISRDASDGGDAAFYAAFAAHLDAMLVEIKAKAAGYDLALDAHINSILVLLLRYMDLQPLSSKEKRKTRINRQRLTEVFQFIEAHYQEQISLEEIAAVSSYSTYYFTRFFREATGVTFRQYLNRYRISKAIVLLQNSNDSIGDISYKTGFGSIKTFNRVFRDYNGCSPTQYRKQRG